MSNQMTFEDSLKFSPENNLGELTEETVEQEVKIFSVSELNSTIKGLLEGRLSEIWLKGEISNFKAHTSGHYYFSLKDDKAQISAVMFKGINQKLKFRPQDGMEVIIRGKITVYEPRGNYQIFCEWMEPVGAGALQIAFDQLKGRLQSEGLFDAARKRALPFLPRHIAIVTSPTGAAVRDMINVLSRRFKSLQVTVVPTKVQGADAASEIVIAIEKAQKLKDLDVLIVARGGGSIEDLWSFNEEIVARAVAACRVPVISGVGHEIDFTICDFVADLRAPTPSAAAELVVKNAADLTQKISQIERALSSQINKSLQMKLQKIDLLSKRLVDPKRYLQDVAIRIDDFVARLEAATKNRFSERIHTIKLLSSNLKAKTETLMQNKLRTWTRLSSLLDGLSPLRVVERGYSIVKVGEQVIIDATNLVKGNIIDIRFAKGQARAKVEEINLET